MRLDILSQVERATGRKDKERLLSSIDQSVDSLTVELLRLALDPYTTFGLTVDPSYVLSALGTGEDDLAERVWGKLERSSHFTPDEPGRWWDRLVFLLRKFASRKITGTQASTFLNDLLMAAPTVKAAEWAMRVVNKDLRCGVNVKTFTNVFPGLVNPFSVQLASPTSKHGRLIEGLDGMVRGAGYIEPKYDGLRCVVVDGVPMSRAGHRLEGVSHILDELATIGNILDYVIDGEVTAATRELSIGKARARAGSKDTTFFAFDLVPRDQWESRKTGPLWQRRKLLRDLFQEREHVKLVPYELVLNPTLADIVRHRDAWIARGTEGIVWKRAKMPYHFSTSSSRPDHVLKFKLFETEDLEIIRCEEGKRGTRLEGTLGAIVCRLESGGEVNFGTGFSDAERDRLWAIREQLPGMTLEGTRQAVKTANDSWSHPVYIRIREDK